MASGTDKIRVLIVDDIPETRENVRKLLAFEVDVEVVGVAATGREAVQLARDLQPNIIMMDINMPDMDGIAATEAIRAKQPAVQVIILSVQSDNNYMRKAMLVGARDFLTKPPMGDELISAIRRAGTPTAWRSGRRCPLTTVHNPYRLDAEPLRPSTPPRLRSPLPMPKLLGEWFKARSVTAPPDPPSGAGMAMVSGAGCPAGL